jgi:hypothetical protein
MSNVFTGIFHGVIPDLSSGSETNAPIIRPIPVSKKGGTLESRVASAANEAHKKIAPRVNRSAFIPKVYGTKVRARKKPIKSKKTKSFSKNTPYSPVSSRIGVYLNPVREWKNTKE